MFCHVLSCSAVAAASSLSRLVPTPPPAVLILARIVPGRAFCVGFFSLIRNDVSSNRGPDAAAGGIPAVVDRNRSRAGLSVAPDLDPVPQGPSLNGEARTTGRYGAGRPRQRSICAAEAGREIRRRLRIGVRGDDMRTQSSYGSHVEAAGRGPLSGTAQFFSKSPPQGGRGKSLRSLQRPPFRRRWRRRPSRARETGR